MPADWGHTKKSKKAVVTVERVRPFDKKSPFLAERAFLCTLADDYTSWMMAISAASPRRGPILTMRV